MKQCNRCGGVKPLDAFHKRADRPDKYRSICKDCRKAADKENYAGNRNNRIQQMAEYSSARIKAARDFVYGYLKTHPCVDCGESDIIVLEFDHVRGDKIDSIAKMVARHRSLDVIQEEIGKCEVRCANCHRRVTAARGNWAIIEY